MTVIPLSRGVAAALHAAGFNLDPATTATAFAGATLSDGWTSAPSRDPRWTHLLDPHGRIRFRICEEPDATPVYRYGPGGETVEVAPDLRPYTVVVQAGDYLREAVTAGVDVVLDDWITPADAAALLDTLIGKLNTELDDARRYAAAPAAGSQHWAVKVAQIPREIGYATRLRDEYTAAAVLAGSAS